MSPDIEKYFKKYEIDAFDSISESPGIYCWYAELKIEPMDWRHDDGSVLRAVNESIQKHRANALKASIKSNFGLKWEKTIHASESLDFDVHLQNIFDDEKENHDFCELGVLLSSISNRELLSKVLNDISPLFNVPLYIGKAYNLKQTLKEHKRELDYYSDSPPEDSESLFSDGKNFVQRAMGAGFAVEELVVYTLDLISFVEEKSILNISSDNLKQIALLVEYILNRRLRPSFGRI